MSTAYFTPLGEGRFQATPATAGPWSPALQHGSPPAALLARAIERAFPRPDARIARLAYDFFGPVPVGELSVETESVRAGARIDLSRARIVAGGRTAMEAGAWRIAVSADRAPRTALAERPPAVPATSSLGHFVDVEPFGYGESLDWRFVEGAFNTLGPATVYSRAKTALIDGEALSPLERLLLMVDSANGISAELPPSRFTFVPVALTVTVDRYPRTEWVGMRAKTTIEPDGIGLVRADLFDEEGFLGVASQSLFVAPR